MRSLIGLVLGAICFLATPANAMNKKEMAEKLAKKADISQAKAADVINIIFSSKPGTGIIATELDAGRKVQIPGFGTFGTKRGAKAEVKPQRATKAPAAIAKTKRKVRPKPIVVFKPAKGLKDRVAE